MHYLQFDMSIRKKPFKYKFHPLKFKKYIYFFKTLDKFKGFTKYKDSIF